MDIISHAIAGAATGQYFGRPILGAAIAIVPDLSLGIKRKLVPNIMYDFCHTLYFCIFSSWIAFLFTDYGLLVFFALFSHLFLDIPTHGEQWAPKLFYPWLNTRYGFGAEWEWFSPIWWYGLFITICWSLGWLALIE